MISEMDRMQIVTCKNCATKNRVDQARLANGEAKCGRCGTKLDAGTFEGKPFTLTDATFQEEVLQATGPPILVDAWAPWCGPCRAVAPVLDQLAAEAQNRYRIGKLNVDENPRIASQYQIASIPTMLIFKDGKLIDRLIGAQPKQVIAQHLTQAVGR
jgi:thioredoxin 2